VKPVGFAQGLFVVVRDGRQKRGDLDPVETTEVCENAAAEGRGGLTFITC